MGAAAFALTPTWREARALRTQPLSSGGLAHVGLALMLIGIVGSSVCSRAEKISLAPGQSAQALGYQVTYRGHTRPMRAGATCASPWRRRPEFEQSHA